MADGRAPRTGDPALDRRIEEAIDRGVAYLKSIQQHDGSWSLLAERPFLFDPAGAPDEREVMIGPIDAFWAEKGERLEWDPDRARFVSR